MSPYLVLLHYQVPVEQILEKAPEHRAYLRHSYEDQSILFSGMQHSKKGGAIIMRAESEEAVQNWIQGDPFYQHQLASYEVIGIDVKGQLDVVEKWLRQESI